MSSSLFGRVDSLTSFGEYLNEIGTLPLRVWLLWGHIPAAPPSHTVAFGQCEFHVCQWLPFTLNRITVSAYLLWFFLSLSLDWEKFKSLLIYLLGLSTAPLSDWVYRCQSSFHRCARLSWWCFRRQVPQFYIHLTALISNACIFIHSEVFSLSIAESRSPVSQLVDFCYYLKL